MPMIMVSLLALQRVPYVDLERAIVDYEEIKSRDAHDRSATHLISKSGIGLCIRPTSEGAELLIVLETEIQRDARST